MVFIIHDTNNELLVHQSSRSGDFFVGCLIVPSLNPNFFLALNVVLIEQAHSS
ncbi:hypothetical protein Fmac_029801 [Flemingia macrophylla]|uniref:Uncharacterized protein n=1 Tax=Flemingia macrophylla TaxID=520843 RepID=A0ABD1LBB8_9FABA